MGAKKKANNRPKPKPKIPIIPSALSSRNKWARSGRNAAHLVCSTIVTVSTYIVDYVVIPASTGIGRGAAFLWQKKKGFKAADKHAGKSKASKTDEPVFKPIDPREIEKVTFADVVGLDGVKEQIKTMIIKPFKHPKQAASVMKKLGGGILMVGPKGNGKTMIARATVHEIAMQLGISAKKIGFFEIRPSHIVHGSPGVSERRINAVFAELRKYQIAVLFIDEAEGLSPSRSKNTSTIMQRVVSESLMCMDGFTSGKSKNILLLLAASNLPEIMDPAFKRGGRFDIEIEIPLPDQPARNTLLEKTLKGRSVSPDVDIDLISQMSDGLCCADVTEFLVEEAGRQAMGRWNPENCMGEGPEICMHDFLEGLKKKGIEIPDEHWERYTVPSPEPGTVEEACNGTTE